MRHASTKNNRTAAMNTIAPKQALKQAPKQKTAAKPVILSLVLISVILISIGQVMMRKGMSGIELGGTAGILQPAVLLHVLTAPLVIGGLAIYGIALALWLGAMSQADVSYLYPLLSIGYIATTLAAVAVLHEQVSLLRWVGTLAVVIGSMFVTRS